MKKILLTIGIVALVSLLVICAGCTSSTNEQVAKSGDTVNVYYTMYVDGNMYQTNVGNTPFTFAIDGGGVISGFNTAVKGMKVGETKKVSIPAAEGYGEKSMNNKQTLSLAKFETDLKKTLATGDEFSVYNGLGQQYIATVVSINRDNDELIVALNSPLAGKTLDYEITLDSIKSA